MSVSDEAQQIARVLADTFRVGPTTQPEIRRYGDESDKSTVDLLCCADSPMEGVTAYGTVRLSDHGLGAASDLRVEIIGAFPTALPAFANVMATCAFNVINHGAPLRPGMIHGQAMGLYDLSTTLRHVMFVSPFLWGDRPETLKLPDRTVAWLMAVPITEAERLYAAEHGSNALEQLFERENINVLDPNRASAV